MPEKLGPYTDRKTGITRDKTVDENGNPKQKPRDISGIADSEGSVNGGFSGSMGYRSVPSRKSNRMDPL
jgi:hypothetical protein